MTDYTWLEAIVAQRERMAYEDEVADGLYSANLTPWGDDAGAMSAIVDDFFAFQAAVCTTQPGCTCGRDHFSDDLRRWQNGHADDPTLEEA